LQHTIEAAVLCDGLLKIESLKIEGPRDDEVLVRMVASGICRTDLDFLGDSMILGHEGAGVAEIVGARVKGIQRGDHLVLSYQSCGSCAECRRGHPARCELFWKLNFGFSRMDGSTAYKGARGHFFGQSSFATHTVVTERAIVKVSKTLDLSLLAPLGCGLQTGAGTIMNSLKVKKGTSVAIFGIGSVGLAAVMAARIKGADRIIGVDVKPGRLACALELGATHVVDGRDEAALSALIRMGEVDYAVDTTGDEATYRCAVSMMKPKGVLALLAGSASSGRLPGGGEAIGVIQGDAVPQRFIPKLIDLYCEGLFPFDRLVTFYDFQEINTAIDDFQRGDTIKPVLRIGEV
jgi:aryl-alcohol dehydrogenase